MTLTNDERRDVDNFLAAMDRLSAHGVLSPIRDPENSNAIAPLCGRVKAICSAASNIEEFWLHNLADATEALIATVASAVPIDPADMDDDRLMSPRVDKDTPAIVEAAVLDWHRVWCGWQILAGGTGPITTEEAKAGLNAVADKARAKIQDYAAGRITAKDYRQFMNEVHTRVATGRICSDVD